MHALAAFALTAAISLGVKPQPSPAAPPDEGRARRTTTFTETFGNQGNEGQWSWNGGFPLALPKGGNRGWFLQTRFNDTYAPQAATALGIDSEFTGDYRATRVVSVGADFETLRVDITADERPLSVLLISDPGTPDDPSDDCTAYFVGSKLAPTPADGWQSYAFDVPADATALPAGWGILEGCPEATPDAAWNRTIQDVDRLEFFYGDPTFFFIFQNFDTGLDNPTISRVR